MPRSYQEFPYFKLQAAWRQGKFLSLEFIIEFKPSLCYSAKSIKNKRHCPMCLYTQENVYEAKISVPDSLQWAAIYLTYVSSIWWK